MNKNFNGIANTRKMLWLGKRREGWCAGILNEGLRHAKFKSQWVRNSTSETCVFTVQRLKRQTILKHNTRQKSVHCLKTHDKDNAKHKIRKRFNLTLAHKNNIGTVENLLIPRQ